MQNHRMALQYGNWISKNYAVDLLHRNHSISCTVVTILHHSPSTPGIEGMHSANTVLHLPVLAPFEGHLSVIHSVWTDGALPCTQRSSKKCVVSAMPEVMGHILHHLLVMAIHR